MGEEEREVFMMIVDGGTQRQLDVGLQSKQKVWVQTV